MLIVKKLIILSSEDNSASGVLKLEDFDNKITCEAKLFGINRNCWLAIRNQSQILYCKKIESGMINFDSKFDICKPLQAIVFENNKIICRGSNNGQNMSYENFVQRAMQIVEAKNLAQEDQKNMQTIMDVQSKSVSKGKDNNTINFGEQIKQNLNENRNTQQSNNQNFTNVISDNGNIKDVGKLQPLQNNANAVNQSRNTKNVKQPTMQSNSNGINENGNAQSAKQTNMKNSAYGINENGNAQNVRQVNMQNSSNGINQNRNMYEVKQALSPDNFKPSMEENATNNMNERFQEQNVDANYRQSNTDVGGQCKKEELFFDQISEQLDQLFSSYPEEKELELIVPQSRWVRVPTEDRGYYVVGVVFDEAIPQFICYGVPDKNSLNPPNCKEQARQWLELERGGRGYWMMYQDAKSGQTLQASTI